jgi:uncharacterized protein
MMSDERQPPPESLLPYDTWTEEALRHVLVRALQHAATDGLPGQHHFYLTFRTDFPGVEIPPRLRAQYPQEMTIVLQHQFWDLDVREDAFSVTLSFQGKPERLIVPFGTIIDFSDPAAKFTLQFQTAATGEPPPELTPAAPAQNGDKATAAKSGNKTGEVVTLDNFRKK